MNSGRSSNNEPAWGQSGQAVARVGRLARKELTEILSDRRTILTLVLMPLLLYPLLSFAFRQFLIAFMPSQQSREYRIGVKLPSAKTALERYLLFGSELEPWRVGGLAGLGPANLGIGPWVGQSGTAVLGPWMETRTFYTWPRTEREPFASPRWQHAAGLVGSAMAPMGPGPWAGSSVIVLYGPWAEQRPGSVFVRAQHEPLLNGPEYDPESIGTQSYPPVSIFIEGQLMTALLARQIDVAVELYYVSDKSLEEWKRKKGEPAKLLPIDWHITYLDHLPRSREAAAYLEQRCALANARRVQAALDRAGIQQLVVPVRTWRKPMVADSSGPTLSLAALVPLILILMTITGAVYPAIDLTAGERERGTLEILVAAPVPRMSLLFAKYFAVVAVAVLTATINLAMMLVTLELTGLTQQVFRGTGVTLQLVIQLFFLLVLFAGFFSALLLTLTSFARSFKEAQAYLIPLMLASLSPGVIGMMPGLQLRGIWTVTPLVNIVLLARDLLESTASFGVGMIVVGSTLAYAAVAITAAARIFGAEAVLFNEQSGWSDMFRRPSELRPVAKVSGALLCLAVLFPISFVASSLLVVGSPREVLTGQVLATLVLFGGLPAAACWWSRVSLQSSLQLFWPRWFAWPAALLWALAAVPAVFYLFIWLRGLDLVFLNEQLEQHLGRIVRPWRRAFSPLEVAALVALIGVAEELFFRGFLFSALRARLGAVQTIFASAALFSAFHVVSQLDRLVPSLFMGLLLGWVCWQTRSVLPGVLLHATYNAAMLLCLFYQSSGSGVEVVTRDVPMWWQIAAVPAAVVGAVLIWFYPPHPGSASKPTMPTHFGESKENGASLEARHDAVAEKP